MPKSFIEKIDNVADRQGRLTFQSALMSIASLVLSLSLLLILCDYLGRFNDPGLRWLATGSVFGLAVFLIYQWGAYLWQPSPSRLNMAQKIETLNSELGSRLSSAVAFYDQPTEDTNAGSTDLRRALVLATNEEVKDSPFNNAIEREPHKKASTRFGIVLTLLMILGFTLPSEMALGFKRLVMPWNESHWPRENHLELVDAPNKITQGESIELVCRDKEGELPDDMVVEYRLTTESGERFESVPMTIVGNEAISTRQNIQSKLRYRVVGGDDHTMAWQTLDVLNPPTINDLQIEITPPTYSGITPYRSNGRLEVLTGSYVSLNGNADQKLQSASVVLSNKQRIECDILNDKNTFTIPADRWQIEFDKTLANATWHIDLQSVDGSRVSSSPQLLRVVEDIPPKLKWVSPQGDVYLTTRATIPIKVTATDDFALSSCWIEGEITNLDTNSEAPETSPKGLIRHTILEPIKSPPVRQSFKTPELKQLNSEWDLQLENLAVGIRMDLTLKGADFLPQEGKSTLVRRVFLVSDEEFQTRLAKKQSRLLATIQEAINRQRSAYQMSESLAADLDNAQVAKQNKLDQIAASEFQQRQAASKLTESLGAISQAERLLAEIRNNRLGNPELENQIAEAVEQLKQVKASPMAEAKEDLAETRRGLQRDDLLNSKSSIKSAIDSQLSAKEKLEQVAKSLTGWSDFQRLSQELATIEKRQRELANKSAKLSAMSSNGNPLQRVEQQTERQKIASEQAENNRRFSQIQQTLQELLSTTDESKRSESQNAAADALQESEERNIASGMRNASSRLARNQMGRAAQQQRQSADDLQEMLETLRSRSQTDPDKLIAKLQEANQQLSQLEQQASKASKSPKPNENQSQQISKESSRMSRKLNRLTAQSAAQKAQQAADSASQSSDNQSQSSSSKLEQSEQALKQAQQEVNKRIAELEQEKAERLLDRLEKELPRFQKLQEEILDETKIAHDANRRQQRSASIDLRQRQQTLEEEVDLFSEGLAPKPIFQHALSGATDQMEQATTLLTEEQLGRATQRSEYLALQRLNQIEQVLKTHREQKEQQQQQGGGQGGANGPPPPPLPFEVAELKMLRLMQLELIDQTRSYQADRAQAGQSDQFREKNWNSEANQLSDEQKKLSELALEIANRNNEP